MFSQEYEQEVYDYIEKHHDESKASKQMERAYTLAQNITSASLDTCSSIAYYLNDNYFKQHFKDCEEHILKQANEIEIVLYVRDLIQEMDRMQQSKELGD